MSIIKEKILYKGSDMSLKIPLGSHTDFTGAQQEIDKQLSATSTALINPVTDGEVRRFKKPPKRPNQTITFTFVTSTGLRGSDLTYAGFTDDDISRGDQNLLNSYFIFDFYDNVETSKQIKLFTNYLTKIKNEDNSNAIYTIDASNQLYNMEVPLSFIDAETGTTYTAYVKIMFYNAKNGQVRIFEDKEGVTGTYNRYYFTATLNFDKESWYIKKTIFADEIVSNPYTVKVNDNLTNFENQQQTYPAGTIYDPESNSYE